MASRGPAYRAALCGVLAALAAAVMTLGTAVPVGTFCCPALAGLLMIPVLDLFGTWAGLGWYAAVAVLSLLLFEGYDYEEAAEITGLKASSVRSQYVRAKARLLEILKKDG